MAAWIVFDKPPIVEVKLLNPMKHCNYLALDGTAEALVKSFQYFDALNGAPITINNESLSSGHQIRKQYSIPWPGLRPKIFNPPLVDVIYNLEVKTLL